MPIKESLHYYYYYYLLINKYIHTFNTFIQHSTHCFLISFLVRTTWHITSLNVYTTWHITERVLRGTLLVESCDAWHITNMYYDTLQVKTCTTRHITKLVPTTWHITKLQRLHRKTDKRVFVKQSYFYLIGMKSMHLEEPIISQSKENLTDFSMSATTPTSSSPPMVGIAIGILYHLDFFQTIFVSRYICIP